ncbi:MAG TPA: F0F1 ATP synthase subunit B [Steroidobacteraceae bacterium]|nr:F0F1 ATP synthase subunit B [Steroidobacteraceae bacterium]
MNFNLTLVIQMVVFALFVWFVMRWVWPHIMGAVEDRTRKIAMGLAAAEKGQTQLVEAEQRSEAVLREARDRAREIVDQAQRRANEMVEQAKSAAAAEGQRLVVAAQHQIELEATRVRESLRRDVAQLAVETASKLLEREIDARAHADLLDKLAAQL